MKRYLSCIFAFILFWLSFRTTFAQVLINEIAVAPSDKQDWLEIYSPDEMDISGWVLSDESGEFYTFPPGTVLHAGGYISVAKYQRFNNDSDTIYLKNAGQLIDFIAYGRDDQVCIPGPEGSIIRIPDGGNTIERSKTTSRDSSNNMSELDPCPTPTSLPSATPTSTPVPTSTPKPTATPKPSATSKPAVVNSNTPTLSLTATPKPTSGQSLSVTSTISTTPISVFSQEADPTSLITENTADQVSVPRVLGEKTSAIQKVPLFPLLLIIAGLVLLVFSLFPIIRNIKKRYNTNTLHESDDKEKPLD